MTDMVVGVYLCDMCIQQGCREDMQCLCFLRDGDVFE